MSNILLVIILIVILVMVLSVGISILIATNSVLRYLRIREEMIKRRAELSLTCFIVVYCDLGSKNLIGSGQVGHMPEKGEPLVLKHGVDKDPNQIPGKCFLLGKVSNISQMLTPAAGGEENVVWVEVDCDTYNSLKATGGWKEL